MPNPSTIAMNEELSGAASGYLPIGPNLIVECEECGTAIRITNVVEAGCVDHPREPSPEKRTRVAHAIHKAQLQKGTTSESGRGFAFDLADAAISAMRDKE